MAYEIYHHGILGQKWGVRRFQNRDGSLTTAGQKRYSQGLAEKKSNLDTAKANYKEAKKNWSSDYDRAQRYTNTHFIGTKISKNMAREEEAKWGKAYDSAKEADAARLAYKQAKKDYRLEKRRPINDKVEEYNKAFNKASNMSDAADANWAKTKEMYRELGRTGFSRFAQAFAAQIGKGSDAANAYLKQYDKASSMSDAADEAWNVAKSKYKSTGRNFVGRVYNNIRYDIDTK